MLKVLETKVVAATAGAGAGASLAGFVLWLLGVLVWGADSNAANAQAAIAAVPAPVGVMVGILVTIGGTFIAGYAAPHTSRTQPTADPAVEEANKIFPIE